ncbi:C39 family peptidase [Massilia sp. 2TAF26]|uniref:C39 family peptidase n=1 Tax=Massilia sp. 2TAF26 TaxID=3233012 RepID=UPI003F988672
MKRSAPHLLNALLCALMGVTCVNAAELPIAGGVRFNIPVHSLKELKFISTTRQQYDFSCGSAALATLLTHHYGYPISETTAFQAMWEQGDQQKIRREGFSLLDMQRYLASIGFKADGFRQPIDKLIQAKVPAIVLISERGYNHFVVVKGAEDGRILLGDPSSGTRAITREHFESIWPSRLLFVIHDAPSRPQFNLTADWRAAPRAPLSDAVNRTGIDNLSLPKFGPTDF